MFEDEFTEKQKDMIALALEFAEIVQKKPDKLFIYGSFETMYSFDLFYKVEGEVLMMHQIAKEKDDLILQILQLGNKDLQDIHAICKKYDQPMPTDLRIVYQIEGSKVHADYKYELQYSNTPDLLPDDIFEQWFEEEKAKLEATKEE